MSADENKEPAASEEREEVRRPGAKLTGEGGERKKEGASRSDRSSTRERSAASGVVVAAAGAVKSLFRLTPAGDAARMWLSTTMMLVVLAYASFATQGSQQLVDALLAIDVFYGLFLILTWGAIYLSAPADVRRWAIAQKPSRSRWGRFVEVILYRRVFSGGAGMSFIVSASLGGLTLALLLLAQRSGGLGEEPLLAILCVLGVLLSWALLHTSYAMFYAHLYYSIPGKLGGMEFPGEEEPAALDFAYFAFAIGTAFVTSDVLVSSRKVRQTVLLHGVLAFFYNTAILVMVLNLVIFFV